MRPLAIRLLLEHEDHVSTLFGEALAGLAASQATQVAAQKKRPQETPQGLTKDATR